MPKYASGKHALAISDRSGLQFPWREMVTEWTGAFVHISEYECFPCEFETFNKICRHLEHVVASIKLLPEFVSFPNFSKLQSPLNPENLSLRKAFQHHISYQMV